MNEEKNVTNTVALGDQIQLMSTATPTSDDVRLYSDLIGWMNDNDDRLALPIGAAINLCAVNDSCCSCDSRWSSSDNSVATVSSSGTITAKAVGTVTITATVGCSSVRCKVTVVEGDIAIIKSKDHNIVGKTIQLKAVTANPDQTVTWSSDSDAASVNSNGTVTVKKIGAFRITASVSGLRTQTVTLYGALSDGVYNIKGKQSAMYFGIAAPNTDTDGEGLKKASVTSYSTGNGVDQMWHLRYQSNGEYVIRSYARPLLALTSDISDSKNVSVDMFTTKTTSYPSECKWTITNESSGFVLKNVSTQAALSQNDNRYWAISAVSNPPKELVVLDLQTGKYIANGETIKLKLGDYYKTRAIYRSPDTIDQLFDWSERDADIAIVNTKGYITTKTVGNTTIHVKERNTGSSLSFNVIVHVPVDHVSIVPHCYFRITKGKTINVQAKVYPTDATNQKIHWSSTKTYVFEETKRISDTCSEFEAKHEGTTIITAKTDDGGYIDQCTVEVTKENAKITKDGNYFKIRFEDGKIWKSIGSKWTIAIDPTPEEPNKRYLENDKIDFSEQQLAFIYLLDPLGVQHYVKYYNRSRHISTNDFLWFKDRIYKCIYGVQPRYYEVNEFTKEKIYYGKNEMPVEDSREKCYSSAEALFGGHYYKSLADFFAFGVDAAFSIVFNIVDNHLPDNLKESVDGINSSVTLADILFFSGSVSDLVYSSAWDFLNGYGSKLTPLSWAYSLLTAAIDKFSPVNTNDVKIYNKVKSQDICANFTINGKECSMDEIIALCS